MSTLSSSFLIPKILGLMNNFKELSHSSRRCLVGNSSLTQSFALPDSTKIQKQRRSVKSGRRKMKQVLSKNTGRNLLRSISIILKIPSLYFSIMEWVLKKEMSSKKLSPLIQTWKFYKNLLQMPSLIHARISKKLRRKMINWRNY